MAHRMSKPVVTQPEAMSDGASRMRSVGRNLGLCLVVVVAAMPPAGASHNGDMHSDNMSLVGRFDDGGTYQDGTDIAFWKDTAVLGNESDQAARPGEEPRPSGFRLVDISDPTHPRQLGEFNCGGAQNDVSIWKDLVLVSVETQMTSPDCPAETTDDPSGWRGIRVVSIKDSAQPVQIAAVRTPCGSHTHTVVPDLEHRDAAGQPAPRLIVYATQGDQSSILLPDPTTDFSKCVVVIEVPLDGPASAHIVNDQFDVSPAPGCHDVGVLLDRRTDPPRPLAGAACISESQIWDISDPVHPKILAHITNPQITVHHSAQFNWEGTTLVLSDEPLAGRAPGCAAPEAAIGALWFYDVSDLSHPQLRGHFVIPQRQVIDFCVAHNYNVVPLANGRDVLSAAWYRGGSTVVDFTDPSNPQQIAFYIAIEGGRAFSWSS